MNLMPAPESVNTSVEKDDGGQAALDLLHVHQDSALA
jgi:hypothetical protein